MYWIEVYFENGKTLRKESSDLNDTYDVFMRYSVGLERKPRVQNIRAGLDDNETGLWSYMKGIVL